MAPVTLLGKIKTGQLASVMPESPVDGKYQAEVKIVDPILDAASGTFRIRLEVPNDDYKLTSGLRCRVRFLDKIVSKKPEPVKGKNKKVVTSVERSIAAMSHPNPQSVQKEVQPKQVNKSSSTTQSNTHYLLVTNESLLPLQRAKRKALAFNEQGLKDTWVIAKGSLKGHISLGYYSNRKIADQYQQQLTDLGIDTRIVER